MAISTPILLLIILGLVIIALVTPCLRDYLKRKRKPPQDHYFSERKKDDS